MRRLLRPLLPFNTGWGAIWFAWRYREPLADWSAWTIRSVPRVAGGDWSEVRQEATERLRAEEPKPTPG